MTLNKIIMQLVLLEEHPAMPKGFQPTFQKVIEAISEMPEIIRCKDCKYFGENDFPFTLCHRNSEAVEANDFCSQAEMREST